ncbi:hypothetical protein, partial [Williamsia soli]|uniref:hypothetical protein n=1 Tax=Williamsia soli TaxID=364929 RepID=UPI001A9D4C50
FQRSMIRWVFIAPNLVAPDAVAHQTWGGSVSPELVGCGDADLDECSPEPTTIGLAQECS